MAVRPSDWFLVDFGSDPTPGDAFGIRSLAAKYADIATIAGDASDGVTRARSSGAASGWIGDAGDIFRDKSHRMPGELAKANDSYSMVAEALRSWADSVDDTQAEADRGLQQAREAHADLASAQAALGHAQSSWSTVHAQQLSYQKLTKDYANVPPPSNVTLPTDYQVRSADRNAQQAQTSISAAQGRIADADARLAAAKALVNAAKQRRDDAERSIVHKIGSAEDHAVKPSSIWEAIQDSAAWQAIVVIATVVLTIVTIIAIFVGGPLVWALIIAATVLLMVNALMSIAQGKDAWGELIMLGIGLIPGGRLLGLAIKGVDLVARAGSVGARAASLIRLSASTVSRLGSAGVRTVVTTLNRAADAALPRVAQVVRSGAAAVIDRLSSIMNPDWLSRMVPGDFADPAVIGARLAQRDGGYAVDAWHSGTLHSGDRIEIGLNAPGGEPGPYADWQPSKYQGFGAVEGNAAAHDFVSADLWGGLQVAPHPEFGGRMNIVTFEATTEVHTAYGAATLANPTHMVGTSVRPIGAGGDPQHFVPDFISAVDQGHIIPIDVHGSPLPFHIGPIMENGVMALDQAGQPVMGLAIYATRPQHMIHLH